MGQKERIQQMEILFDNATEALAALSEALDKYEKVQTSINTLEDYYDNGEWKKDYEADEKGLLPKELKRGVLSQDGIWNLLSDDNDLKARLREASKPSALGTIIPRP